jgi:hypothetical protein
MAHTIDNYKKEEKENEKVNIINHKEFEPKFLILNHLETKKLFFSKKIKKN